MILVGIGGGTGSGKTTLANGIADHFGSGRVAVVQQDSYYFDRSHMPVSERKKTNFDHPDAFDMDLLVSQMERLKTGEPIEQPVYCYKMHTRSSETRTIEPCGIVVLEGILVLHARRLRELMDFRIYVHAPDDVRLIRRLRRDMRERARTVEEVIEQYFDTVRPMHVKFVEPTREHADLVVSGEGDPSAAVRDIIARIESAVRGGDRST